MNSDDLLLEQLKATLESCAFLVSQEKPAEQVHAKIVSALVLLEQLQSGQATKHNNETENSISNEINKVSRRLKRWAKNPQQINSQILNAFLELEAQASATITEAALRNAVNSDKPFDSNFAQMKIIAAKNHGKIFEQYGNEITIWPPVAELISEYKQRLFAENNT